VRIKVSPAAIELTMKKRTSADPTREITMGLFSKLFGNTPSSSLKEALSDAVYRDACALLDQFVSARGSDRINGFAFVNVHDAVAPYVMGTALEDNFGPVGQRPEDVAEDDPCGGFNAEPADWYWSAEDHKYHCAGVIEAIHQDAKLSFEELATLVFRGTVDGLKKFDASGKFRGQLPRDQMLLMQWIHDPAEEARMVMVWVAELNPAPVSKWFNAFYPYRNYA
jgi:hypothetical protein